jgi:hypothetical protein
VSASPTNTGENPSRGGGLIRSDNVKTTEGESARLLANGLFRHRRIVGVGVQLWGVSDAAALKLYLMYDFQSVWTLMLYS